MVILFFIQITLGYPREILSTPQKQKIWHPFFSSLYRIMQSKLVNNNKHREQEQSHNHVDLRHHAPVSYTQNYSFKDVLFNLWKLALLLVWRFVWSCCISVVYGEARLEQFKMNMLTKSNLKTQQTLHCSGSWYEWTPRDGGVKVQKVQLNPKTTTESCEDIVIPQSINNHD